MTMKCPVTTLANKKAGDIELDDCRVSACRHVRISWRGR